MDCRLARFLLNMQAKSDSVSSPFCESIDFIVYEAWTEKICLILLRFGMAAIKTVSADVRFF